MSNFVLAYTFYADLISVSFHFEKKPLTINTLKVNTQLIIRLQHIRTNHFV
jgi:hypothetical protein